MSERTVGDTDRRRLLGRRHLLTPSARTDDVVAITRSLVALHSTDPVSAYLSVLARMRNPDLGAVADALYAERSLVRHHAMRRTLWVSTPDILALMHHACTLKIAAVERRKTEAFLATSGVAEPGPWLADAKARVCRVLAEQGPITTREIGALLPDLARPLSMAEGKSYAGIQGAHSRVVTGLGFDGLAVRTQPSGTWINGQYAWATMQDWAPALHTGIESWERQGRATQAELARLWLVRFGPGTETDLSWWAGWTKTDTRAALAACEAEPVTTTAGPAWALPDSLDARVADEPWVALLPSLDPTVMGWKRRDFYLPPGGEAAWDSNGNAGPTMWVDGQVVGAWAQTKSGEIRLRYFAQVPERRRKQLAQRADEVGDWLGDTRISWRFPGAVNAELIGQG